MRNYIPCWDKIGISKDRYLELLYFCRQYDRWKHEASAYLGIRGKALDGMPHGAGVGDPVAMAAERRMTITAKIDLVEQCALAVSDGQWMRALIDNVCRGKPYSMLSPICLPTSHREDFFKARREFFVLLDHKHGTQGATNI